MKMTTEMRRILRSRERIRHVSQTFRAMQHPLFPDVHVWVPVFMQGKKPHGRTYDIGRNKKKQAARTRGYKTLRQWERICNI